MTMKRLLVGLAVSLGVFLVVNVIRDNASSGAVKSWCRQVRIGDYQSNMNMPKPVSVADGLWEYEGGVSVQFVDGMVYSKSCG